MCSPFASTWSTKGDPAEARFALVLERDDNVIHLCEIKFSNDVLTITKNLEDILWQKMEAFREVTGTKKALQITLITPFGAKGNTGFIVSNQVTLNDLFKR